jgi:hypothetical protein
MPTILTTEMVGREQNSEMVKKFKSEITADFNTFSM